MAQSTLLPKVILWVIVSVLAGLLVAAWLPFYPAIAIAVIGSILTRGWFARAKAGWLKRTGKEDRAGVLAALQVVAGSLLLILIPLGLITTMIGVQVAGFANNFKAQAPAGVKAFTPEYVTTKIDEIVAPIARDSFGATFSAREWFDHNRESISQGIQKTLGRLGYQIGYGALMIVVGFLTLFFFLRDGHKLKEPICNLLPLPRDKVESIGARIAATTEAVLVGVVIVSLIQGTIAGLAYAIAGVPNALMWSGATVVVCMIPLLGAPLIYAPLGLILLSQGEIWQGCVVLGVGFLIVSQIDNILRPIFIGAKTSLHPMAIFFSLLGGVVLVGPLGLFLGPMILSALLGIVDAMRSPEPS